jgi:Ca2+-binding EF-hand superfamily protein
MTSFCSGNGFISTQTLREILAALDDKLGPDDLDGIIAEIDTDGSGTVDFDGEGRVLTISTLHPLNIC